MQDKTSLGISDTFREYIEALVEEVVINGEPFDAQKKWLRKYSEAEGLDYETLEKNLNDLFEAVKEMEEHESKFVERSVRALAKECYLSEALENKLIDNVAFVRTQKEAKQKAQEEKERKAQEEVKRKAKEEAERNTLAEKRVQEETGRKTKVEHGAKGEAERKKELISVPLGLRAIDLGLPSGTKWANMNVGAINPEDFGNYYAWGEIEEKDKYGDETYIYRNGRWWECRDLGNSIGGTQFDVAHVCWGGKWAMPSFDQIMELVNNCSSEWTKCNGINGRRVTGPNGNSIFFPAAGEYHTHGSGYVGRIGKYWSCSQFGENYEFAGGLTINDCGLSGFTGRRDWGFSVRPIERNR